VPPVVSKKVEVPVVAEPVAESAPVEEATAEVADSAPEAAADSDKKE
jgi:hypothetical protein